MKVLLVVALALTAAAGVVFGASAAPTAFTYQGRLYSNGDLASGSYNLTFKAYDLLTGGTQIGPTLTKSVTPVSNGYFQVPLDFGPDVSRGVRVWLEITVQKYHTIETPVTLSPRQEVTPAASTLYAQKAAEIAGPSNFLNHVVRLDITGKGTYYFQQMTDLSLNTTIVNYLVQKGTQDYTYYRPGNSALSFTLVRYATADNSLWAWKDSLITTPPDGTIYIIDTRTSTVVDAYAIHWMWPCTDLLQSDEQGKYVVEKVTFTAWLASTVTTGGTINWQSPPAAKVVVPTVMNITPSQQETFESFAGLGWQSQVVIPYSGSPAPIPGTMSTSNATFSRASTGNGFLASWYTNGSGDQTVSLPMRDSSGTLVFTIQLDNCWPGQIGKVYSSARDGIVETFTFAYNGIDWQ
jgi:hypothetical protein